MNVAKKVVFNSFVLYAKIIVSMAISLISVPLVLKALGASDYGLYHLVAGVVAMLSFLKNSLAVSSQRYMSVAMGTKDDTRVDRVYNASFKIHFIIGVVVVSLLEIGSFYLGKLNIEPDRIVVAQIIYQFLIVSTFLGILSVPFNAIINAHEDMVVFSVIGVIDSLWMLALAISLQYIPLDRLVFYGFGVAFISVIVITLAYSWTRYKYKKYRISLLKYRDSNLMKEMFGFAGWNVFGALAVIGRNQGVAIVINMFLGTIANAAYGVAHQINGALLHFSATFQKAINPQLMKSEGMNNRARLHKIAFISSKFSVLALCFFAIPLIMEMPEALAIWLGDNIPEFTLQLSQLILVFSILYQYSNGLMSSIQATGNIRYYTIIMGIIILMNIPVSYVVLKLGMPVYYVTVGYVVLEIISLIVRVFMAHNITGMDINGYWKEVLRPTFLIVGLSSVIPLLFHFLFNEGLSRLFVVCIVYAIVYCLLTWFVAFDKSMQERIKTTVQGLLRMKKSIQLN